MPRSKRISLNSKLNDIVFLVGAGISLEQPSNIPIGSSIIEQLLKWIAPDDDTYNLLKKYSDGTNKKTPFDILRFELLLDEINEVDSAILDLLQILQNSGYPNFYHYFLSLAISKGSFVITTNFDTRIEEASEDLNIPIKRYIVSTSKQDPFDATYNFLKLHGSFLDSKKLIKNPNLSSNPIANLSQVGKIGFAFNNLETFKKQLVSRLSNKILVVVGYSASDSFDVIPLIEEIKFNKILWCEHILNKKAKVLNIKELEDSFLSNPETPLHLISLGIQKKRYPKTESYLFKGRTHEFLKYFFPKLYDENVLQNHKFYSYFDPEFSVKASLNSFISILEDVPLDPLSKEMICKSLLIERYGNWENLPLTDDSSETNQYVINITNEINIRKFKNANKKMVDAKKAKKINQEEFEYLEALLAFETGELEKAFVILFNQTKVKSWQQSLRNLEARFYLYDIMLQKYFFAQKFRKALKYANKTIELAEKYGVIWETIRGRLQRGKINMQMGFDVLYKVRRLKYHFSHYFEIAKSDFEFVSYYSLRVSRIDFHFEVNRYLISIYESLGDLKYAKYLGYKLFSIIKLIADKEVKGVLFIQLSRLEATTGNIKEAKEFLKKAIHQAKFKKEWKRGKELCLYQEAIIDQHAGELEKSRLKLVKCLQSISDDQMNWDLITQIKYNIKSIDNSLSKEKSK